MFTFSRWCMPGLHVTSSPLKIPTKYSWGIFFNIFSSSPYGDSCGFHDAARGSFILRCARFFHHVFNCYWPGRCHDFAFAWCAVCVGCHRGLAHPRAAWCGLLFGGMITFLLAFLVRVVTLYHGGRPRSPARYFGIVM